MGLTTPEAGVRACVFGVFGVSRCRRFVRRRWKQKPWGVLHWALTKGATCDDRLA